MATNPSEDKERKPGIFQWLIIILVPLIFTIIITVIILYVMGVDVGKYTKETLNKIPFVAQTVATDEEELHENNLAKKDQEIANLEEELETAKYETQTKDTTIAELEEEIANLTTQLAEVQQEETGPETDENTDGAYEDLSESFSSMKPKTAAPIIENMENSIAISLLKQIDPEIRGEILGEMEPEIAADYSSQLVNQ
ncbi:flagellar protein FlbB [Gracilibacillus boraciitolerans JCM 21714]|uniref:Flagellar protein FlbB n=1 Tax=Gracilibacillus boraciitolerans JCM 21714 TaxID=1298598 RepID=W4VFN0_9BACI|nr:hypothetical protein [Gracilibacillus boraciitolerans]GAE91628.1 flagellar protein FlbB [Gracilibacillus boraciitolerans JCM 21714]